MCITSKFKRINLFFVTIVTINSIKYFRLLLDNAKFRPDLRNRFTSNIFKIILKIHFSYYLQIWILSEKSFAKK